MEAQSKGDSTRADAEVVLPANEEVAHLLDEIAALLAAQGANRFRVAAYRRAASAVRALSVSVAEAVARGADALMPVLAIGPRLARTIAEIVARGRVGLLDRLRGEGEHKSVLTTVAGIGPELAERIHRKLGIDTLEDLEMAAHEGRLATVPGFGERRVRAVVDVLAGRLARRDGRPLSLFPADAAPSVGELLDVDRQYRLDAAAGRLRRIAPRRFNPGCHAWLPVLHTERGHRHYTAMFSNTARAHERGMTADWVVIFLDDGDSERQATVVTETHGPLAGRRVVRGREPECADHYAAVTERRHAETMAAAG